MKRLANVTWFVNGAALLLLLLLPAISLGTPASPPPPNPIHPPLNTVAPVLSGDIYLPVVRRPGSREPASGWPQYRFDAARTGYNSAADPARSFREKWSKNFGSDGIAAAAEAIVAGDRLLFGTEAGIVYALALADGHTLWQRQLEGGIVHTAAATVDTVFVATLAGNVYALDLTSGDVRWHFKSHDTFATALLLVADEGVLVATGGMGAVYALELESGAVRWQVDLGYAIRQSPTYGDNHIYVGAEDMRLYALSPADGQISWRSDQLYGRSFHNYAPVFAAGKLLVNVMPDSYTYSHEDLDLLRQAQVDVTGGDLSTAQDATLQWLTIHPESQTSYAIDAATGKPAFVPGVLYVVVNSGAQPPPVYGNGTLYTAFHATSPMWLRKQWVTADHSAMGTLDLGNGRITARLSATPGEFTSDETNNYSGAGDLLFGARCQMPPACTPVAGASGSCSVDHTSLYPFTHDLCVPGAAPIFARGHLVYHAFDTLTVYEPIR